MPILPRLNAIVLLCCLALLSILGSEQALAANGKYATQNKSIAFYYADQVPVEELMMFDQVVVEPTYMSAQNLKALTDAGVEVLAYISIGEVRRQRPWYKQLDQSWIIGKNKNWDSEIVDLSNEGWHRFVQNKRIAPLLKQGFSGVFLDTLDSFHLLTKEHDVETQRRGLAQLIQGIHQQFPDIKMLLNRGFDVVADVHDVVHGVVAESLFQTWNGSTNNFVAVENPAHQWLKNKLQSIQQQYHLPIYVIDYVAPTERDLARATAKKIIDLGFSPWVSNIALDMLGVGSVEIIPRKILLLYDKQEGELAHSTAHRLLAMPLEYMGYSIEYHNVREWLPSRSLIGRYAGVVTWFGDASINDPQRLMDWIALQVDRKVPVVLFNSIGMPVNKAFLKKLGLIRLPGKIKRPVRIIKSDPLAQMEAKPKPLSRGLAMLHAVDPAIDVHERIEDANSKQIDVVLTAPWGGLALAPYVLEESLDEQRKWRLNIFDFLSKALQNPAIPMFDVSTENGQRLLMTHIDGDGAASKAVMPGSPLAIKVIYDKILRRYPLPATVSVITSQMPDHGLYPKRAAAMRSIAKKIFKLPHVEVASHTYSHPFNWEKVATDPHQRLTIPGYQYSLKQEIDGSVQYINTHLAPPNKPLQTFLWSGDALPGEEALKLAREAGVKSMNGGHTAIINANFSLTNVSAIARPVGQELQIYAPIMNENIYTDLWKGPRYGFERVIETFKLTDLPRRLKALDIYYHFYSGSDFAALSALERVYDWAIKQETMPLPVSDYVAKVEGFYQATLARRTHDNAWLLHAPEALKTLRLPQQLGWPKLSHSRGVIGVRQTPQGRYVHLHGAHSGRYILSLQDNKTNGAYLIKSNAAVTQWNQQSRNIRLRLQGAMPIVFQISQACTLQWKNSTLNPQNVSGGYIFRLKHKDTGNATLLCP